MDKFLKRNPTWKTKTYGSIVASAAKKKPAAASTPASPQRRPLQDSNLADSRRPGQSPHRPPIKSQSHSSAADLLARAREKIQPSTAADSALQLTASKAIIQYRSESQQTIPTGMAEARPPNQGAEAGGAPAHENTTPTKQDSHYMRLQQDLNSPSAALRLRAIRALKSPTRSAYNNFDVSHTEHSIITMEERNPIEPPTLQELLKDVVIYVEVRTGNDNRSDGVRTVIAKMGAQVNDRLRRNTTHVIFKDGLLSTYKKAIEWNIPVVSILWIEACKVQRKLCDPNQFPISNIHKYEYPELYGKIPRVRCMQTDYELKKWVPKQPGTPTSSKDTKPGSDNKRTQPGTPTTTPKNDISRFFRALNHKKTTDDNAVESPATKLLNRISSGSYTPLPAVATAQQKDTSNGSGDAAAERQLQAQKSLEFREKPDSNSLQPLSIAKPRRSTVEPTPVSAPVRTSLRRSSAAEITSQQPTTEPRMTRRRSSLLINSVVEAADAPAPILEPRTTRRRSSLHLASKVPGDSAPKQPIETISEELAPTEEVGNSIVMEEIIEATHKTNCIEQSIEISAVQAEVLHSADKLGTLYAYESMDISAPRRRSVATSSSTLSYDMHGVNSSPSLNNVTAQTSNSTMEEPLTPIFSSTRLPGAKSTGNRRRTLFNLDMDVVNENIERMNESHRRSLALANEAERGECRELPDVEPKQVTETASTEPKRRRLFNPNDEVVISPPKSNRKSRLSITGSTGSVQKRRSLAVIPSTSAVTTSEALAPIAANPVDTAIPEEKESNEKFVTPEPSVNNVPVEKENSTPTPETHKPKGKPRPRIRTLVHTNMHQEQVQVIYKALRRLRGMRLDPTVTQRTTHLVSLEPRRTLNLLRGLMRGVWIVSYQWVLASMRASKWVKEEPYELTRFSRAIEICRTERQAFGIHYKCELFRFMEPFYVSSLCRPIQFNNMKELLLLGGAKLTENRFKAKYVIGDKRRAEDERLYLSPYWVLDSITHMQIQRFGKYLMKSAIVTPAGIIYNSCRDREMEMVEQSHGHHKHDYIDPPLVMDK